MPTNKPRLIVTLEPALHKRVRSMARARGTGLSATDRDLIRAACDGIEIRGLAALGNRRMKSLKKAQSFSHAQAWSMIL